MVAESSKKWLQVDSPNVSYSGDQITVNYEYSTTSVKKIDNRLVVSTIRNLCWFCMQIYAIARSF